jgi:hypothetical protein
MLFLRWVTHFLGVDYGTTYGHWVWYNFWSGVAGSFLVGVITWSILYYLNHTCHAKTSCFRWGKYSAANGTFKLCYRHHPDFKGRKPTRELIHRLHEESKR